MFCQPTLSQFIRRVCREIAGAHRSMPVRLVAGSQAPVVTGRSYHWVTPGGRPVHHPNAYRRAWGKPIYVCSTLSVEVGIEWVAARDPALAAELQYGAGI